MYSTLCNSFSDDRYKYYIAFLTSPYSKSYLQKLYESGLDFLMVSSCQASYADNSNLE